MVAVQEKIMKSQKLLPDTLKWDGKSPGWKTSQSPRLCWGRRPALKAPPKAPFRNF